MKVDRMRQRRKYIIMFFDITTKQQEQKVCKVVIYTIKVDRMRQRREYKLLFIDINNDKKCAKFCVLQPLH